MDIPAIEAFLTVAELKSFSRAAETLFITQPAISKRIATLEEQLGVKLFDRFQKHVILTEAGKVFYPGALRVMEALRESKNAVKSMSGDIAGELCIATSHHIGLHRLPPILKHYVNQYPLVNLNMRFMDSESALLGVENAAIEVAVITLPGEPVKSIKTYPLWNDPLLLVVGSSHPLVDSHKQHNTIVEPSDQKKQYTRPIKVDTGELCKYAAILPQQGTFTREIVDRYFHHIGIKYQVKLSSNYLETIKMMVSVGLGWSVLPKTMLDNSLTVLEIENFNISRSLGIVHHASRTLSRPAEKMFDLMLKKSDRFHF